MEAPSTFRMPISLVRRSDDRAASPNKPKQARAIAMMEENRMIFLQRCSSMYCNSTRSSKKLKLNVVEGDTSFQSVDNWFTVSFSIPGFAFTSTVPGTS